MRSGGRRRGRESGIFGGMDVRGESELLFYTLIVGRARRGLWIGDDDGADVVHGTGHRRRLRKDWIG